MPKYPNIELTNKKLRKFAGIYSDPNYPIKIKVSKEGRILKTQGTNQPYIYLECYEKNKFENQEIGVKMEFNTKKNELIIKKDGETDTLKRE